jgi:hypothetical protein
MSKKVLCVLTFLVAVVGFVSLGFSQKAKAAANPLLIFSMSDYEEALANDPMPGIYYNNPMPGKTIYMNDPMPGRRAMTGIYSNDPMPGIYFNNPMPGKTIYMNNPMPGYY